MVAGKMERVFKIVGVTFFLFLANLRMFIFSPPHAYNCIFAGMVAPEYCAVGGVGLEIILWLIFGILFLLPLQERETRRKYWFLWTQNKVLVIFLVFALLSIFWTIFLVGTLRNLLVLFVVTLVAAFWRLQESTDELLGWLAWFVGFLVAFAFFLALQYPNIGQANFYPYDGAWRGMFRNRNYLGSFMAFGNLLFLVRLLGGRWGQKAKLLLNATFYLLTLSLVVFSKSATGAILLVALHFFAGVAWLWLRLEKHLNVKYYYGLGIVGILGSLLFFWKLDIFLGLFNRNTTFTGRINLWRYLLEDWVSKSPLVGHGYGAVWYSSLKYQAQRAVGWLYLIHIGDSGFMDILLNLGWIGLGLLLMTLIIGAWRALRFAIKEKTIISFFPLLTIVYVILTNITLSYFMELEVYVWALLVLALFWVTPNPSFSKTPSAIQKAD